MCAVEFDSRGNGNEKNISKGMGMEMTSAEVGTNQSTNELSIDPIIKIKVKIKICIKIKETR